MMKLCVRKSDGTIYEPSSPDDYNMGNAISDMLSGRSVWYFRRVRTEKRKWWQLWKRKVRFLRTGEIWQPKEGNEFDVIDV